ncbi:NAD(P)H-hydrate dehydratase [Dokdonella soli]|uniref:Bifunctional NAD(P)H-hydrate repair enzyme n=1 Tax=Dokdonella soli TaxID=529810 RepID=A0ABN1ICV1_9GAMM
MPANARSTSLYRADQVRGIDRHAIEQLGIPGFELMQRAAAAAFALLRRRWPAARRIALLAGSGNNGGDAFLLGALALQAGFAVEAIALTAGSGGDAARARDAFESAGGHITIADAGTEIPDSDICVDGLFGTGLARPVTGVAAALIGKLNAAQRTVLALDVPSGLDADSGSRLGACVRAEATISFVAWKRGLFTADGVDCCGALELATLDLPENAYAGFIADAELLDDSITGLLAPRRLNVNKSSFGHVLAIGGDEGMGGAIRLTGEAALRCGAGLVSIATRHEHVLALNAARPELMAHGVDDPAALAVLLERATVVAVGPGLGQGAWGRALDAAALDSGKPAVVDADALNLLAQVPRALPAHAVLSPHPGEAARLLGSDATAVQRDRYAAARELAARHAAVVVLKGAGSLIADPQGRVAVCRWGNPGMASGGMGDVLTGVIAALLAQGLSPWDAARLGVALHARAGDLAAGEAPRGLLATDLFAALRRFSNGFA